MNQLQSSAAENAVEILVPAVTIDRLPEEVLCTAFEMSVADLWYNLYPSLADETGHIPCEPHLRLLRLQPFTLGAVCHLWHAVARHHAPLWRHVVLDPVVDASGTAAAWASYIALLEKRSKQTPTDMVVYLSPIDQLSPMRNSLARLAERARSMLLIGPQSPLKFDLDFLDLLTGSGGQHLESFILQLRHGDRTMSKYMSLPRFFPEVNKLRVLELESVTIPWEERNLSSVREAKLVFSRRMAPMTAANWQTIFATIPNTHTLFLTLGSVQLPRIIKPSDLIYLNGVRDFVIDNVDAEPVGLLRLPHVERVQLSYIGWTVLAACLRDSLSQSGAEHLTKITVLNSFFNAEVARGLATIPTLEELDIIECGIQDEFFYAFEPDKCPNLRAFTYRRLPEDEELGSDPGPLNAELADILLEFVSRRTNANNRLQVVKVPGWLKQWRTMSAEMLQSKIDFLLQR